MSARIDQAGKPLLRRRGAPVVGQVLEVVLVELARVGYGRLSVPLVAKLAGVNKTSVYRRWPTKAGLVRAAIEQAMGHDAPLPDTGALRSDALAFALAAAAWAGSPIGRGVMKTLATDGDDPDVRALVAQLSQANAKGPRALFARAISRGELDDRADVEMAMSIIAGAMSHRILVENEPVTPAFVNRLVSLVIGGLTAESG